MLKLSFADERVGQMKQNNLNVFKHLTTKFIQNAKVPLEKELRMNLNYQPSGIRSMEKYIIKHFPNNQRLDYETLLTLGLYYGHIFEKNFEGAHWNINADNVYNLKVVIPSSQGTDGVEIFPLLKMMEFAFDKKRSIHKHYIEISTEYYKKIASEYI